MQNWGDKIFSNQQLGMTVYIEIVKIIALDASLATSKNLVVRRTMICTKTFINTPIENSQLATAHVLRKVLM
jgi:hypothetical protein